MKKNFTTVCAVVFLSISLYSGMLFLPRPAHATPIVEGSRSSMVIPCTCMPGYYLVISTVPPRPGMFLYGPSPLVTHIYSYGVITPPAWQLGDSIIWGSCWSRVGYGCVNIANAPLMRQVGTSVM